MGNAHPSIAPYETLPTADGVLVLAVGNDRQFGSLCEVLGLDLASDPDYATNPARVAHRAALAARLGGALATRPTAALGRGADRCRRPGRTRERHPRRAGAGDRRSGSPPSPWPTGVPTVANPITLSRTPVDYRLAPPSPHPGPGRG